MQPQSDKQSAIKSKLSTTTTTRATNPQQQQQPQPEPYQQPQSRSHQRSKVKVIKSKRPLCHFKFYLDICDHQLTKRIESEIKALGGTLEFFLNDSITHFITDKDKSCPNPIPVAVPAATNQNQNSRSRPGTPLTPATPNTSASGINEDVTGGIQRKSRQTRADTILSRVREAQQSPSIPIDSNPSQKHHQRHNSNSNNKQNLNVTYIVWQTEYALRFFQRIQTELRQYLQGGGGGGAEGSLTGSGTSDRSANIQLKGNFIKIESIKRNHRPYYHLIKQPEEWPKLDLSSDDGAFRLQAKKTTTTTDVLQSMTRKSLGSRTSQRQLDKDQDTSKEQAQRTAQLVPLQHAALQACKKQAASIQTPDSPRSHCRDHIKESSDKQCGVCEICKIEYDTLTIHLQSKDHELFAKNANNFLGLDTLIQVSASLSGFLQREEQLQKLQTEKTETETEQKDIEIYSDMEVDELLSDSAIALTLKSVNQTDNNNSSGNNNSNNNNNNNNRQRPSPVLREKSKRITKGKHSSEKFQATPNSPTNPHAQTPTQTPSPTKKVTSLAELQRMELSASNNATTTAATPTNPTRRKTNNSVLSPPIRAMLPPSSLYKVVEASDATATPPRMRRGATNATIDSPSLIVKFQKVRQSELQRLNGEAENFMFPRTTTTTTTTTRSSSELLTDVDRQTTSDARGHHSISSASIDSTSELEAVACSTATTAVMPGRAAAVGRRRKGAGVGTGTGTGVAPLQLLRQLSTGSSSSNGSGGGGGQQRFPNAPIQPEMQSQLLKSRQTMATTTTTATATATRKSSRMATAIVTAATTSSQLQLRRQTQSKLEDGMGEQANTNRKKMTKQLQQQQQQQEQQIQEDEHEDENEEDDDEDDDVSSCSSGSDEDYVASTKLSKSLPATTTATSRVDTREERAARRLSRISINLKRNAGQANTLKKSPARRSIKYQKLTTPKAKQEKQQTQLTATTTTPTTTTKGTKATMTKMTTTTLGTDLMFDCSKSLRLQKLRYAFEELPNADLWHHVFQRQDAGEEHYYSYYGSTRYRKLPYEMGPIPMERTKSHNCKLCPQQQQQQQKEQEQHSSELKSQIKLEQSDSNQTTTTTNTTCSMYKHKKLHLLQRYQQEQQQQQKRQQQQQLNIRLPIVKCDSKASTPELMERDFVPLSERAQLLEVERACSSSSSCSNSNSNSNSQKSSVNSRNKHLARVVDLPPRKSPREHASTLALVSCIIRQRQDSQSKTNSEAEEPTLKQPLKQEKEQQEVATTPTTAAASVSVSTTTTTCAPPNKIRSQAATPVEELRFATEISETVKRMRRGQNKYDAVTTTVPATECTSTPARCRRPTAAAAAAAAAAAVTAAVSYSRRLELARREVNSSSVMLGKRKRRQMTIKSGTVQSASGMSLAAGVRKLPSKKGILEYEMEDSALKALDASMQYVNPMLIAWQIDKYLELTNRDLNELSLNVEEEERDQDQEQHRVQQQVQTPPPTDYCFTSEFDLCDLLAASAGSGDDDDEFRSSRSGCRRNSRMNLFSSYQRKRKCLKSNRTGWPRVQRRRAARTQNDEPINFRELGVFDNLETGKHQGLKQEPLETEEEQTTTTTTTTTVDKEINREQDDDDNDEGDGGKAANKDEGTTRQDAVMTPPATDVEEQVGCHENDDESVDEAAVIESQGGDDNDDDDDDDDETMADSVDQQHNDEAEIEATDADVEEDEDAEDDDDEDDNDDDDDDDVYEDAYGEGQATANNQLTSQLTTDEPPIKRERIKYETIAKGPVDNARSPAKEPLIASNGYCLNVTSTPNTRQPRQQQHRRTPQLNGSLGSCISPSEKLGDNSDIFTVSSDGLETDLDLSNTQAGDSMDHCQHQHLRHQTTPPKRKFDISKYAPPNSGGKAASSCAAEAATAAVKSLAISQFLKKEVRVQCRRLRAPFRRFRYRR
ncbi:protein chiffon-like isoform X2 [Drosophila innubila]|uniref:protein chiffon-like isoform X2 n=1 Tax=Drosophila innubila TaxID=198719 RepID=UPI00148C40CE|nr:protein chiffon-like isoform X2 [Drosophila innubila]